MSLKEYACSILLSAKRIPWVGYLFNLLNIILSGHTFLLIIYVDIFD